MSLAFIDENFGFVCFCCVTSQFQKLTITQSQALTETSAKTKMIVSIDTHFEVIKWLHMQITK